MHIVQISAYYPPHLGGQENAVQGLSIQLAANDHMVQVITAALVPGTRGVRDEDGVQVQRLHCVVFGHAPIMPGFVRALLRTPKDSIIHVHIGQAFTPEMVWLLAKLTGRKYIAEFHIDFEPSGPAGFLLPLYKRLVLRRAIAGAASVIVLNQQMLQVVRGKYGYKGNIAVLSNGIDEAFFAIKRPPLASKLPAKLRLLFVGRLTHQKNLNVLIDALPHMPHEVQLDIIGEGEEYAAVAAQIAQKQLTNVTMHGRLSGAEVRNYYQICDALVMPSLYEAQPLVLLEAMAAGIPIIGSDVVGVAEHIRGVGIIVPPTADGMVDGVRQFCAAYGEPLAVMARRGRAKAETLRWQTVCGDYEAVYEVAR